MGLREVVDPVGVYTQLEVLVQAVLSNGLFRLSYLLLILDLQVFLDHRGKHKLRDLKRLELQNTVLLLDY